MIVVDKLDEDCDQRFWNDRILNVVQLIMLRDVCAQLFREDTRLLHYSRLLWEERRVLRCHSFFFHLHIRDIIVLTFSLFCLLLLSSLCVASALIKMFSSMTDWYLRRLRERIREKNESKNVINDSILSDENLDFIRLQILLHDTDQITILLRHELLLRFEGRWSLQIISQIKLCEA